MWSVVAGVGSARKRLIARSDNAGTSRSTGSLVATDPVGIVTDERFAKVSPVGVSVNVRSLGASRKVRAADDQRLLTENVGELDPNFFTTGADMHDQAQRLIPKCLHAFERTLRRRCPRSDPMLRVLALHGTRI